MQRLNITVPDDVAESLRPYHDRLVELLRRGLAQIQLEEALRRYRRGEVSLARAAELAGLTREELIERARAAGIEPRWSEAMVREELA